MPSDTRSASRRLRRAARPLRPNGDPYYMHNPRPGVERYGPGWYWTPAGEQQAAYLGFNSIEAEITLRELVRELAAAHAPAPGQTSLAVAR